jgi:hypothetical protein
VEGSAVLYGHGPKDSQSRSNGPCTSKVTVLGLRSDHEAQRAERRPAVRGAAAVPVETIGLQDRPHLEHARWGAASLSALAIASDHRTEARRWSAGTAASNPALRSATRPDAAAPALTACKPSWISAGSWSAPGGACSGCSSTAGSAGAEGSLCRWSLRPGSTVPDMVRLRRPGGVRPRVSGRCWAVVAGGALGVRGLDRPGGRPGGSSARVGRPRRRTPSVWSSAGSWQGRSDYGPLLGQHLIPIR